MAEAKSDDRLVFDCLSAVLLLLVAVLGEWVACSSSKHKVNSPVIGVVATDFLCASPNAQPVPALPVMMHKRVTTCMLCVG